MATKNLPLATVPGTGTLMLPQFAPGMLLQHDDLAALGEYSRDLSRLLFRTLFGCGVLCGLVVSFEMQCRSKLCITVSPGIALDPCGDPIQVAASRQICVNPDCNPKFPRTLYVVLGAKSSHCAPRTARCDADDDVMRVCTREKFGFEICVMPERPTCACGCPDPKDARALRQQSDRQCADPVSPCYADHYAGHCVDACCDGETECNCGCDQVLLARLVNTGTVDQPAWEVDHRVRRFARPVLIDDPQVRIEEASRAAANPPQAADGTTTGNP
jgi:hypothetical protein